MEIDTLRQQARELTQNFYDAIVTGLHQPPDFYKMLWIVHWAVEFYGQKKTREVLEEIMLEPDFDPVTAPLFLRDALLKQQPRQDVLGRWFEKALKSS